MTNKNQSLFYNNQKRFFTLFVPLLTLFVYLGIWNPYGSTDTVMTTTVPYALLERGEVYLDNYSGVYSPSRSTGIKDWAVHAPNGHIIGIYPIGTAFVTFPIQFIIFNTIKVFGISESITGDGFDSLRLVIDKLTASILASLSVLFFFLAASSKFSVSVSLVTSMIYAFATNHWNINAQILWQHSAINFLLTFLLFILTKKQTSYSKLWGFVAGSVVGLLISVRPTSGILAICFSLYCLFVHRFYFIYYIYGALLGVCPAMLWNIYFFYHPLGAYWLYFRELFEFNILSIVIRLTFLLFHPFRGIVSFMPIFIFLPLIFTKLLRGKIFYSPLNLMFVITILIHWLLCGLNTTWAGGFSYGPRYMLDVLPMLMFIMLYVIEYLLESQNKNIFITRSCFLLALTVSFLIQLNGQLSLEIESLKKFTFNVLSFQQGEKY